jgi:hypothetical protein
MTSRITDVIIDCHALAPMAEFWCAAIGYETGHVGEGWLSIRPAGPEPSDDEWRSAGRAPAVAFVLVPEGKAVKNRVHLDITPVDCSQQDEVARLTGLGARQVDIGQQDTRWVVMADPEGNEFCVMPALEP